MPLVLTKNNLLIVAMSIWAACGAVLPRAGAGTTWEGGGRADTAVTAAANWSGDTLPAFDGTQILTFGRGGSAATLNVSVAALGVVFDRQANFSVDGAETLTLGSAGLTIASTSQTYTVAAPVALAADQAWSLDAGSTLALAGALSGSGGLTKQGAGNLLVTASPTSLAGSVSVAAGSFTGAAAGGTLTLTAPISVSSGAILTQSDNSLVELTGSFSSGGGATLASPNQSGFTPYAVGTRGIVFRQGDDVTVSGTIRPSARNQNRFGVIGVSASPTDASPTAMTIAGVVQADVSTAHLNFTLQGGSSIYVAAGAMIDNLHIHGRSRRQVNFYGDGSAGANLELDPLFVADPVGFDDDPERLALTIDDDPEAEILDVPDHVNAVEFGYPRIAGITFVTHADRSLPVSGIGFNSISGNVTGVDTTSTAWRIATSSQTYDGTVQVQAGVLTLDTEAQLTLTQTTGVTIANGARLVVQRSAGSGFLEVNGALVTNSTGLIDVIAGNELRLDGSLTDAAPSSSALNVLGTLSGTGTINTSVAIASGTLAPGPGPATMTFTQPLSLGGSATLLMELGGAAGGGAVHDQLVFGGAGTLALGGTLSVTLGGGFSPMLGDSFDLFALASAPSGTFATLNLPALDPGLNWDTDELYTTTGTISVVPEPTSLGLLTTAAVAALFATGLIRGRRRAASGTRRR
jgi:hypothetical protein